jgi:hypothetical protein
MSVAERKSLAAKDARDAKEQVKLRRKGIDN